MFSKFLITIIYSLGYIFIWGLLLIDAENPGIIGVITALLYTFYADIFYKFAVGDSNNFILNVRFVCPIFYLLAALYTSGLSILGVLLNPILSASLVLLAGLNLKNINEKYALQFFTISFILLYSLTLHSKWQNLDYVEVEQEQYDFKMENNDSCTN